MSNADYDLVHSLMLTILHELSGDVVGVGVGLDAEKSLHWISF